jgi:5-methyltetrahydropteroyltriglutamate--homocysteine methyltransferase
VSGGLLTTTVGSFPKPDYVVQARNEFSLGKISRQELAEVELKATAQVIRLQEDIGLDILVDGEMYRGDMPSSPASPAEKPSRGPSSEASSAPTAIATTTSQSSRAS